MGAPTNEEFLERVLPRQDMLVRYIDGSKLIFPIQAAGAIFRDKGSIKAVGREGLLLVVHRR